MPLRNSGFSVLNYSAPGDVSTIIILGVARSGTTMVAAVLQALGVFLGDKLDSTVQEDLEMAEAIETDNREALSELVRSRNSRFKIWAFKRPMVYARIQPLLHIFRNARVVAVFRDAASIAKRNEISVLRDFSTALKDATRASRELAEVVSQLTVPTAIFSYEKALADPNGFVRALTSFCGIMATDSILRSAAMIIGNGPDLYLRGSQIRFSN